MTIRQIRYALKIVDDVHRYRASGPGSVTILRSEFRDVLIVLARSADQQRAR